MITANTTKNNGKPTARPLAWDGFVSVELFVLFEAIICKSSKGVHVLKL